MADDIVAHLADMATDHGRYRTHYEGCHVYHLECAALMVCAEIERLRSAGDALAHLMPHAHLSVPCRSPQGTPLDKWCSECAALAAWKEARRG